MIPFSDLFAYVMHSMCVLIGSSPECCEILQMRGWVCVRKDGSCDTFGDTLFTYVHVCVDWIKS